MEPSLPSACPTAFQSEAPAACCGVLAVCGGPCGAEHATSTSTVARSVTVIATVSRLRVLIVLPSFQSPISADVSARVAFFNGRGEDDCADESDDPGYDERHFGRQFPEKAPDRRRGRDRDAAHKIVEPDGARPQVVPREVHDHGLARRLAGLPESPDDEGHD